MRHLPKIRRSKMSKFFYINREQLDEIAALLDKQSDQDYIVLQQGDKFSDVVKYNSKYDTAVFLTVSNDSLRRQWPW